MNPGLTEPSNWGSELVDQSNSNIAHTTTGVGLGIDWPANWGGGPIGVDGNISNVKIGTMFDDVSQVAIPEPSTLLLTGLALGSIWMFRRRR